MFSLLRIEYLPTILIPTLAGIYIVNGSLSAAVPTLFGWCLLAIGQNLLNDYFDKDRKLPIGLKGIFALFLVSTILGLSLFPLENVFLPTAYVVLMIIYNYKTKKIPFGSIVIQVMAYAVIPFFYYSENLFLEISLPLILAGFSVQLVHEIVDKEATYSLLKDRSVILAKLLLMLTIIILIYDVLILNHYILSPLIVVFLVGLTGLFINPFSKDVKIVGAYSLVFLTIFFIGYMINYGMV